MLNHKQTYNLNQRGKYTVTVFIPTNYYNYPSTPILRHANILAEVNKLHHVHILIMTPYKKCTVRKYMYVQ